jgi:hypothetical protein
MRLRTKMLSPSSTQSGIKLNERIRVLSLCLRQAYLCVIEVSVRSEHFELHVLPLGWNVDAPFLGGLY